MKSRDDIYKGDWQRQLRGALARRGFLDVVEFLRENPVIPLKVLATELLDGATAVQLLDTARSSALRTRRMSWLAKDLFIRYLHELAPQGWSGSKDPNTARAVSFWQTFISQDSQARARQAQSIVDYLLTLEVPMGWLPANAEDPILVEAFGEISFDE